MIRMCPSAISLEQPMFADFHCGARKEAKIHKCSCTGVSGWWILSLLFPILSFPSSSSTSQTKFDD